MVCNNAGSVTVESLCIHRLSPSLQARDLPPACFLDSYSITNQQGQKEEEEGEEEDGRGMAGRWSRGWEEYEPCGIGLTSHSLPSAAQDM